MYACAKIGVVMVTMNPVFKSNELDYVLKQSDMKALCIIDQYRDIDYKGIIRELVPESLTQQRGYLNTENTPSSRTSSTWDPRSIAVSTMCLNCSCSANMSMPRNS